MVHVSPLTSESHSDSLMWPQVFSCQWRILHSRIKVGFVFECCSGFLCKEAGQRVRSERALLTSGMKPVWWRQQKWISYLGPRGLCESVLSPSGFLILFPRMRSLLTHFPLFSDVKPNYMGTPGWPCVCVWYVCACECAHVCLCAQVWVCVGESESCSVLSTLWSHVLYKSMEFSRPEYWSGWTFPNPGDLSNPRIEPRSPTLQVDSLPAEPQGKPKIMGVGSLSLLQQIFPTQESNWGLLHCKRILYQLSYQARPGCVGADPLFLPPLPPVFWKQMQRDRKPTSDSWT